MKKGLFWKGFVLGIIVLFVGASLLPSITIVAQKNYNVEDANEVLFSHPTQWREDGTAYDSEQSLYPCSIKLRGSPTSGLIESPHEYDPTHGVLFCYKTNKPQYHHKVVVDLVVELTKDDKYDEIAYVVVFNESEKDSAISNFTANGANMSKVEFIIEPIGDIWIRDFGPHFIWQNGALGIVDSLYPREGYRPLDNFIPTLIGDNHFHMPTYDMGLYFEGGNFLSGPNHTAFISTHTTEDDNPGSEGYSDEFIENLLQTYLGIDEVHFFRQLPETVDGTQHIDMYMYIIDEDTVIISKFHKLKTIAYSITENAVQTMQDLGYTVYRTPAWNTYQFITLKVTHYTYTNSFRVNNRIFIPTYSENNPKYADEDKEALDTFKAAAPDLEIVQIDCSEIIKKNGAIHCIVKQVPRYTDPEPSVHVIWPDGGEFLASGTTQTIEWCATDTNNTVIPQIDLYYSIDGGKSYDLIASTNDTGFYNWTVPYVKTNQAKIKVEAISEDYDKGVGISADVFNISSALQSVYDFSTGAGENKYCYGYKTEKWDEIDGEREPVSNEISLSDYEKIASSNATLGDDDPNRYISPDLDNKSESTHIFVFNISEGPKNIEDIEILWEGYSVGCAQTELYVWDRIKEQWGDGKGFFGQNRYMDNWAGNMDGNLKGNIRSDFDHYIDPYGGQNQMRFLLYTKGWKIETKSRSFHDYISLTISRNSDYPNPPIIDGPKSGKKGESYEFTFNSVDPEGDDVNYYINWGDGVDEDWNGPHPSGGDFKISHPFPFQRNYTIEAKAKDIYDHESDWMYFDVGITRTRPTFNSLLYWFLERFPFLERLLNLGYLYSRHT